MADDVSNASWWQCDRDEFYRRLREREAARIRAFGDDSRYTAAAMAFHRRTRKQQRQVEEEV